MEKRWDVIIVMNVIKGPVVTSEMNCIKNTNGGCVVLIRLTSLECGIEDIV